MNFTEFEGQEISSRDYLLTDSFPKYLKQPGLSYAKARIPKLHPGLPCGWVVETQVLLAIMATSQGIPDSRKLESEVEPGDWHRYGQLSGMTPWGRGEAQQAFRFFPAWRLCDRYRCILPGRMAPWGMA